MQTSRPVSRRRRALLVAATAAPCGLVPLAVRGAAPDFDAALQQRLAHDGVGFAAALLGPDGVRVRCAGVTRAGGRTPVDATTLFELGSLTKPFVALLFADGVLERRWSLDDAVEDALPDGLRLRDAAGEPLRLIDLATHRSGLPRLPLDLSPIELADPYRNYSSARLHAFLRSWRPQYRRAERFEYSNLGYGLLALVLARRLGLSLDEALQRRVLGPLGLDDVRIARPLPQGDDLAAIGGALAATLSAGSRMASGHDAARRPTRAWQFDAMAGAIGLIGSINSVARFLQAASGLHDTPLAPAFAQCLRYRTEGEHPLHPFGLAWEMSTIVTAAGTRELFNQDGATGGFSISAWLEPERQRAGAVIANAFIETRSLALRALDPALDEQAFNRMLLPAEALAPLAGNYVQLDRGHALDVQLRDGKLWLHAAGTRPRELLPRAPRQFFIREAPLELDFGSAASPSTVILYRDGQAYAYRREP